MVPGSLTTPILDIAYPEMWPSWMLMLKPGYISHNLSRHSLFLIMWWLVETFVYLTVVIQSKSSSNYSFHLLKSMWRESQEPLPTCNPLLHKQNCFNEMMNDQVHLNKKAVDSKAARLKDTKQSCSKIKPADSSLNILKTHPLLSAKADLNVLVHTEQAFMDRGCGPVVENTEQMSRSHRHGI